VSHDAFGLFEGPTPPFVRKYANLAELLTAAARAYIDDVRSGRFPE
jgi:3-methyl-2-oxobutanoate hydroxymethyltransferase